MIATYKSTSDAKDHIETLHRVAAWTHVHGLDVADDHLRAAIERISLEVMIAEIKLANGSVPPDTTSLPPSPSPVDPPKSSP